MKKQIWFIAMLVFFVILTGCGKEENNKMKELSSYIVHNSSKEVIEDDFIYRLVSEKGEYNDKETVKLYAELEYIGEHEEITIFHAMSPFYFQIEEKVRGFTIDYPMAEPLITRTLVKGIPFREEYKSSGGFSPEEDKDYVSFMEEFLENGFPPGYYVVKGSADFFTGPEDKEKVHYHIQAEVDFKVIDIQ